MGPLLQAGALRHACRAKRSMRSNPPITITIVPLMQVTTGRHDDSAHPRSVGHRHGHRRARDLPPRPRPLRPDRRRQPTTVRRRATGCDARQRGGLSEERGKRLAPVIIATVEGAVVLCRVELTRAVSPQTRGLCHLRRPGASDDGSGSQVPGTDAVAIPRGMGNIRSGRRRWTRRGTGVAWTGSRNQQAIGPGVIWGR